MNLVAGTLRVPSFGDGRSFAADGTRSVPATIRLRRAKTLIELLVIVSMLSVVFAGSATTLAAMFRLDRQFRRDLEQAQTLARLGTLLRRDAHEAKSAQATAAQCVLALPDGREIHYLAAERSITREIRRGQTVEHRDAFYLPAPATITLAVDRRMLRLTIRSNATPAAGVPPVLTTTVEAAIGLPSTTHEVQP